MTARRELPLAPAPDYGEERIAGTWQRIADARERRDRVRRRLRVAALPAVAVVAGAVAIGIAVRAPERRGAIASTDGEIRVDVGAKVTAATRTAVALDDGSRLVLDAGARMLVLSNDGERFSTLLEHGAITYDVRPGGPRRWEIETSLATVEVVGTRFVVAQDAHEVTIVVERGAVMVRGERVAGRVQRLTAGQRLVVTDGPAITAQLGEPASAPTPAPSATDAPTMPPGLAGATGAPVRAPSSTSGAAVGTARSRSPAPATRDPDPDAGAAGATLAAVIERADRLRPMDPGAAAALLERALANRSDDSSAGLAAFALGRLYLESLGQPGRAAEVFRRIVNRGNPRALLEDAHARLVEALIASGDREAARAALHDYEHAYPDGRRTAGLRERLAGP